MMDRILQLEADGADHSGVAKAEMTAERLHEVVGTTMHSDGATRRQCNVYRITPRGLDELRKRG
jgi:hypothetical protein